MPICHITTLSWKYMIGYLAVLLGFSIVFNLLLFLIAYRYRTDKLTDISYALTFITLGLIGAIHGTHTMATRILAAMVCLWAVRLGGFLFIRIWHKGKDSRFNAIRNNFWSFGKFWLAQGLSVWVILIAALEGFRTLHTNFPLWCIAGVVVWFIGLALESTADIQKFHFSQVAANKGRWIEHGVWSWSRHPNYFGEMLVWTGVYTFTIPLLPHVAVIAGVVSPLYIICLLLFVSGLPPLEKGADKRWGDNPAYRQYKKRTSILIPWPPKKK